MRRGASRRPRWAALEPPLQLSQQLKLTTLGEKPALPGDVSPYPNSIELNAVQVPRSRSIALLTKAINLPGQDSRTLAQAARVALALGLRQKARTLAARSLAMEAGEPEALKVLDDLSLLN